MDEKEQNEKLTNLFKLGFYKKKANWKIASSDDKIPRKYRKHSNLSMEEETDYTNREEQLEDNKQNKRGGNFGQKCTRYNGTIYEHYLQDEARALSPDFSIIKPPSDVEGVPHNQNTNNNCVTNRLNQLMQLTEQETSYDLNNNGMTEMQEVQVNANDYAQMSIDYNKESQVLNAAHNSATLDEAYFNSAKETAGAQRADESGVWVHTDYRLLLVQKMYNNLRDMIADAPYAHKSDDSFMEFMREVQTVPHSSFMDRSFPEAMSLDSFEHAELTMKQIAKGIYKHSVALQKLLHEAAYRNVFKIVKPNPTLESAREDNIIAGSFFPHQPTIPMETESQPCCSRSLQ